MPSRQPSTDSNRACHAGAGESSGTSAQRPQAGACIGGGPPPLL